MTGRAAYMTQVNDSRGVQTGDGNVQVNLFSGEQPRGPVVAGDVPGEPPAFQPREDLMAQLRATGKGVPVVRAVTGPPGVGKTQLAAAYARECIDDGWRLVAWINARDTAGVLSGLALVADRVGIDSPGTPLETIAVEVRNRLEADGERCLVVYDNVSDPESVRPYVPAAGKSQVVLTSTSTLWQGRPTHVGVFTEQESLDFLAERTGLRANGAARNVAEELGHLPLALAQAAAVVGAQHLTYPVYLKRLRSKAATDYLKTAESVPYPRGAAEAILLSIETVTAAGGNGLCRDVLGVVALLSRDGVPRELLYLGTSGRVFAASAEAIDEALARLSEASLLNFGGDETSPTVTAHRLVMRVVRESHANGGTLTAFGTKAAALLAIAMATLGEPWQHRARARDLVKQVVALNDHLALNPGGCDQGLTEALLGDRGWALWCLNQLGDSVPQAIELAETLLADFVRLLGEDHPETLRSRNKLALAYRVAGRVSEAVPLYERTLADRARVLGEEHPDTLRSRNSLGLAYLAAGRVGEAVALLDRSLADRERVLGAEAPDTLMSRNNLALAYKDAGRLREAVALHEATLAARARVLGEDAADTLQSKNNLAIAYKDAGQVDDAIAMHKRALADRIRVLGEDHPDTLKSRNNLALAYLAADQVSESAALLARTLADRTRVLGGDHPDTLKSLNNLALAYRAAGQVADAVLLYERALADRIRVLGEDHPDTLWSRSNLADAYWAAGRTDAAAREFELALAGLDRVLGEQHPDAVTAREKLALLRAEAARDDPV